jgi:hypothetical protein
VFDIMDIKAENNAPHLEAFFFNRNLKGDEKGEIKKAGGGETLDHPILHLILSSDIRLHLEIAGSRETLSA